ncbi:hypothetical protein MtrunA17_Chr8g0382091 [Medicago truncatula]|uniref:Uncharacterized protein n=2 Tax=Medicago truncatula TaxID=3880 RepID=A0A396GP46_MEDTR|nr:hypothetical protein MtrunA17_Chr8g0382091 [Medicago truncatula]
MFMRDSAMWWWTKKKTMEKKDVVSASGCRRVEEGNCIRVVTCNEGFENIADAVAALS